MPVGMLLLIVLAAFALYLDRSAGDHDTVMHGDLKAVENAKCKSESARIVSRERVPLGQLGLWLPPRARHSKPVHGGLPREHAGYNFIRRIDGP